MSFQFDRMREVRLGGVKGNRVGRYGRGDNKDGVRLAGGEWGEGGLIVGECLKK